MVLVVFFPFFFYMGIFILSSFPLWACGCTLQTPVPVGSGTRREGWEEISTTIRQTMQGLSTVHKAAVLVKANHSSKTGQETIFLQATYRALADCAPALSPPQLPAPARTPRADGVPVAGTGLEHGAGLVPRLRQRGWAWWSPLHRFAC